MPMSPSPNQNYLGRSSQSHMEILPPPLFYTPFSIDQNLISLGKKKAVEGDGVLNNNVICLETPAPSTSTSILLRHALGDALRYIPLSGIL